MPRGHSEKRSGREIDARLFRRNGKAGGRIALDGKCASLAQIPLSQLVRGPVDVRVELQDDLFPIRLRMKSVTPSFMAIVNVAAFSVDEMDAAIVRS